jgi:hypothetical protein
MGRPSLAGLSPILACPLRPAHDLGVRPELPTGTVTFLFTEVEGSTGLLQELGAERYPDALAPGNPHAWGGLHGARGYPLPRAIHARSDVSAKHDTEWELFVR